jgi:hypothetical protein
LQDLEVRVPGHSVGSDNSRRATPLVWRRTHCRDARQRGYSPTLASWLGLALVAATAIGPTAANASPASGGLASSTQLEAQAATQDPASALSAETPSGGSDCFSTLQSLVDAAPPGATVNVPACVYREKVTLDKPITLVASAGAEIRGTDVWNGWDQNSGRWISQLALREFSAVAVDPHACDAPAGDRCLWPEQVFMDGASLAPVGAGGNPSPGQFGLDAGRHIVLADDPSNHVVEVTTRTGWIITNSDNVTVQGFTMRYAANSTTRGAISNYGFSNWTLQDSTVADAHSADISLDGGTNVHVLRTDVGRGGLVGISGADLKFGSIEGNKIHDNRTAEAGFNRDWGAGGLKLTRVAGIVVDGNEAAGNDGVGLWCDIRCNDVTFSNNRVHHNQWQGINFEVSDGANIHDNSLWENGWGKAAWGWGAGIVISSSANANVFNNTVAWNYAGISVIWQNRPPDSPGPNPTGNSVHDNTIIKKTVAGDFSKTYWENLSLAWLTDGTSILYDPASDNHASNNRVWYDSGEGQSIRFTWNRDLSSLNQFADTLGGTATSYIAPAEKDQILTDHGMPTSQEH